MFGASTRFVDCTERCTYAAMIIGCAARKVNKFNFDFRYSGLYDENHWEDYPGQICPSQVCTVIKINN
jgi:hypothetical protein